MIARFKWAHDSFWLFHKQMIDENLNELLEKKPDERLWLNVSTYHVPDYNFATYRLKKYDLIKVGRVRFKVREIVSPIY